MCRYGDGLSGQAPLADMTILDDQKETDVDEKLPLSLESLRWPQRTLSADQQEFCADRKHPETQQEASVSPESEGPFH